VEAKTKIVEKVGMSETSDRRALDDLYTVVYEELRRLAAAIRRGDASGTITLSPTALVNEAWLKLAGSPHLGHTTPVHFKRLAGRAMRQVLVEAARRRATRKRGGGDEPLLVVAFDDGFDRPKMGLSGQQLIALDEALHDLARVHPRQAAVVEGRFFGGLENAELAAAIGVSASTVGGDWRMARAWLSAQLQAR
jgi:RNA polymerase sigma factor (TIGR02999 family)